MIFPGPRKLINGVITMEPISEAGNRIKKDCGYHIDDIDIQSCSAMDCTGLIPSLPVSDAEIEHYNQLYRFIPEETGSPETRG